jgi:hypothetical protein
MAFPVVARHLVFSSSPRSVGALSILPLYSVSSCDVIKSGRSYNKLEASDLRFKSQPSSPNPTQLAGADHRADKNDSAAKNIFIVAVGKAVDTLREDVPTMMTDAPSLDIFSEDVVLTDSNGNHLVRGKKAYGAFFAGLRWGARLTLATPTVKVCVLNVCICF